MPRVSVVIPVYSREDDMLGRAVTSVLEQTMSDFEIIVVDDGSPSPHAHVASMDPRIRYFQQPNRGVSAARNVGVLHAHAELIAFLDHDDVWLPTKLEQQLSLVAEEPDAAFWCTGFIWVDAESEIAAEATRPTYWGLLGDQMVLNSSVMVRKADYWAAGGYSPVLTHAEDWDLFLRLCLEKRAAAVATPLVRYFLHSANASHDYYSAATAKFAILAEHERRAVRRNDVGALRAVRRGYRCTRELFAHQAIDAAREALGNHNRGAALKHLARASRWSPRVAATAVGKAVGTRARVSSASGTVRTTD
ncbi:glycosyltransferase family 2 protein [Rathayibacter soli]|uniref:glycosyltransferase family 2 protein n=1 Tax=Rathayibacter soli TaxID=3144168 RepID=UPI0027E403C6|nr:glycosyltransferase family A protein [Glaciibacter superstes]